MTENSIIENLSQEILNHDLTAAQIIQIVAATVEQVLSQRSKANSPLHPQVEEMRKLREAVSCLREEKSSGPPPPPVQDVPFSTEVLVA
ncbi:hypothetical protein F511_37845 [Dorcoceras hygrometricum]|uniref:Uncharacterized protein n=1 Tax=Dorcoceras hygrometricum TaxID=472368 RepID=A0A2Z7AUP2_9LAMI|nr:hypothetical protein F511_37845 [Dorcoceras hygrometricum]